MSKGEMRSKEEILEAVIKKFVSTEVGAIMGTLEALLDIRDILDERMPKGIEISGGIEETIK